jgi:hypothetical protein
VIIDSNVIFKEAFVNSLLGMFKLRCVVELGFDSCLKKKRKSGILTNKEVLPLLVENGIITHSEKSSTFADILERKLP